MLWNNGYPLIESHLDRLQDSADYFAFPCDRADVKSALLTHATSLSTLQSHKVRLLLHNNGTFHVASKPLPQTSVESNNKPLRVRIASQQTDSRDPLLFHKTTHRPLYTDAYKAATAAGFDDVLFLNTRGEVTESAIANLIIEKSGFWFTPPIECGLLAGVQRSRLLATRNNIEEKVLYLEDLRMADVVYLVNAVRSLRIATIQWETD
jgi:para-aminobenzoate synthetase/4-amino-4-deoxychorismate lyase